jgi:predicted DNA-binding transcriptional regulator
LNIILGHQADYSSQKLNTIKIGYYILKLSWFSDFHLDPEVSIEMGHSSNLSSPAKMPDKVLELISSRDDGLLQSELRKLLGIESSKCLRIVYKLMQSGHIKREIVSTKGYHTYLLRPTIAKPRNEPISQHIDTYLTEIYLLYLMRGSMN